MEDHHHGDQEQGNLQDCARMPPTQKTANDRYTQEVEARRIEGLDFRI